MTTASEGVDIIHHVANPVQGGKKRLVAKDFIDEVTEGIKGVLDGAK